MSSTKRKLTIYVEEDVEEFINTLDKGSVSRIINSIIRDHNFKTTSLEERVSSLESIAEDFKKLVLNK